MTKVPSRALFRQNAYFSAYLAQTFYHDKIVRVVNFQRVSIKVTLHLRPEGLLFERHGRTSLR